MTEKLSMASSVRARRDPTSRHSMYVLRQDGPELSFADAVKSHDALLTSIYGSRSVDQHLTTTATAKADVSALGNASRPRSSAITFPPAANKSSTSSVWQPLFHHTTLVGSAAPLLATFKRDTHVQTENEIRNDVGVQTEEPAIRPTATYKRDVLVQTCEVWADLASGGGGGDDDVTIGRYSEISPNFVGDTCPTVLPPSPRGECTVKGIYERIPENRNQPDNSSPSFGELVIEVPSQSPVVGANFHNPKDSDPTVPNEKSSIESANFSPHLDSNQQEFLVSSTSPILIQSNRAERSHLAYPDRNYVSFVPICKSEVTYFLPQKLERVTEERICAPSSSEDFEDVEFPRLESNNDPALECPTTRCFTTYEEIALKDPQSRDSRPNESESALRSGFSPKHNAERFPSRTLSPVKPKTKENRNSLNMDDYKYDRLSSCNTSERGSMVSVLDALYADSFKFESCENLDQLEEEIIRSLCTPVKELEENLKPTFQEDSIKDSECFPSIPYSVQQVERTPVSPRFFSNMSDQQKTEWHSDAKLNVYQANRDSPSDNEVRSPDGTVRTKTPTKIDRSGMQARGEIIEKLMKGECVDAGILNSFDENSVGNLHQNEAGPQPARENEITVDLLPPQSTVSTGILEVRRSSWSAVASATDGSRPVQKTNGEMMKHEYNKMDNLATRSPVKNFVSPSTRDIKLSYPQDPSPTSSLDQTNATDSIPETYDGEITKSDLTNRPLYWPLQRNADSDSKVKSEFHININSSDEPSSSTKRECFMPPEADTDTDEKMKSYPAAPPPPAPPPPPPPPPPLPPQCYQSVPQTNGLSVDNVAKGDSNPSCRPYSKASSPGNSGFSPSNQKDLMMQELTERFQRRQKDSINSHAVRSPQNERINHVENNNSPGCDYKDSANITSHHPSHTQKESSPGSNTTTFKSVWPSTNGEDYRNHNGKDEVYSSTDYKNGIQYNNNYGSHEVFPNPESNQPHQVGSHSPNSSYTGQHNESPGYSSKDDTKYPSPFPKKTIITDEPPPRGAILVDQKVTVEGDQVHTDKYYAVPLKEVLKEKTSTAKFTPAPPKYEGIGPTEDGVPTGLRQSVRKENMSNWYKTMFKSLHKAGHPHYGGYSSDPEFEREEKAIITKCATLDNRQKPGDTTRQTSSRIQHGYPPSAKSTLEVYNVHPRPIEDYEPGYSSAVDNENTTGSKRFLPSLNHPKPSYEFKCGYESDTSVIRKLHQPDSPHPEQQKLWYREIQRGGDIPQYGLGKPAPEKPKEPVIGPAPSPSYHSSPMKPNYPQAVRPHTPPPEYVINNDSGATDVSNGNYSVQMQHAIHAELQRRMSPSSQQTPVGYKTSPKSPSKSPELKMFAKVLYDFVSESPRELNLKKEELVLILKQLDKNWYEGERKGAIGIFPVSYVEILPPEHVSPQVKQPLEGLAKAVYDFRAQTSVELPLKKGDTVSLIRRVDQNWYEGRIQDRKGIFPATYVQVVQEPGESGRSSLSPKPKAAVSPHSVKLQEDCVKKSPSSCPAPPPSYSNTHSSMSISNSPNASGRTKKGSSLVEPVLYRALYGYSPQNADELELLDGDNVYVVEMCDDGWFVGTSVRTGVFGIFPGNYVEKVCLYYAAFVKEKKGITLHLEKNNF